MPNHKDDNVLPEFSVRQQEIPEEYTLHNYRTSRRFNDFFRSSGPADKRSEEYVSLRLVAILYLLFFIVAELNIAYVSTFIGLLMHATLLIALCFLKPQARTHKFPLLLALALLPLLRLFSLSIPLAPFRRELWYFIISLPAFMAVLLALRLVHLQQETKTTTQKLRARKPRAQKPRHRSNKTRAFMPYNLDQIKAGATSIVEVVAQLIVVATGPAIGWILFKILPPVSLADEFSWSTLLISSVIFLVSTALLEELLFRRLLLDAVSAVFGAHLAGIYVSILFATMYVGHQSTTIVPVVFVVGLFYSWIVSNTDKIWGVTLSHGLANICLFLIFPLFPQFLSALSQL